MCWLMSVDTNSGDQIAVPCDLLTIDGRRMPGWVRFFVMLRPLDSNAPGPGGMRSEACRDRLWDALDVPSTRDVLPDRGDASHVELI